MVLINELTVEQINAALLHLQRSKDEVVGGNKGTTIQNITISNSGGGGGNNVDYSGTIKNLANLINKNTSAIEKNAGDIAKLKSDFSNIEKSVEDTLEGLVDNGISDLSYDPLTKQLTITTNDGDIYQAIIEQDIGYLSYDSATNKLILTTGNQSQEITLPYILSSEKGSANGVATLDENGRVPYSQLPESAMEFLGQWNASTNTPHLADGTGTNGDFYIVSAGGTVNLGTAQDPHIVTFSINDRIVYEGDIAQWVRLPAGQVSSVNGQSGEVTLTASDIEYSTGVSIKAKIDANAVQADWNVSDTTSLAYIKNKPSLATVATSGSYTDLSDKPTLGTAAECNASCFRASTWNPNMNDVSNATSVTVAQNTVCRKIIMTNLIKNVGYRTRVGIGLQRSTSGWGEALLSVGTNDEGTTFYDYKFSNTGVLTAACFCGNTSNATAVCRRQTGNTNNAYSVLLGDSNTDASNTWIYASNQCTLTFNPSTGDLKKCGGSLNGYTAYVGQPSNTMHYVLVDLGNRFGGNTVAQIYNTKYFINKSDSNSEVITEGETYGSFAYAHLGTESSPSSCIWLRFCGWKPMLLWGSYPITIVCNTTTAPSGITFVSPRYMIGQRLYPHSSCVLCTTTANNSVGLFYGSYSDSSMPGTYGNIIQMQSGTGASNRWGYQVAFPTNGCLQYRRWTNTTSIGGWNSFITSENIGSQHVTCADCATCADRATCADVGELSWTYCGCGVYVSGCLVRAQFYQDEDRCIYWNLRCFAQVANGKKDVATPRRTSVIGSYCCVSGSKENHNFSLTALAVCSGNAYLFCSWSSTEYLTFCCSSRSIKDLTNFKLLAIR